MMSNITYEDLRVGDYVKVIRAVRGCMGADGKTGKILWLRSYCLVGRQNLSSNGLTQGESDVVIDIGTGIWALDRDCIFERLSLSKTVVRTIEVY